MFNLKITKMKNLFSLLCLVVLLGVSANVMGQGTGINPQVGSVHTYTVNAVTGTTPSYVWKVTTNGNFADAAVNLLTAGTVVSGASTSNSIELTWVNPVIPTIYYLHLEVTADGCSNNKVIAIQPVNSFAMDIANVDVDGTTIATDFSECAPDVITSAWTGTPGIGAVTTGNATSFTYDYGVNTFYFKVTATGVNTALTDWLPKFALTHTSGGTIAATWGKTIATATTALTTGATGVATDNTLTIDNSPAFFIKIVVTNGTADEGITARTFKVDLDPTTLDENGNTVTTTTTDNLTQTIKARPNPGSITY